MKASTPHATLDRMFVVLVIGLISVAVTWFELANPGQSLIRNLIDPAADINRAAATSSQQASKPVTATPAKPKVRTAATISYVHLRAEKSTKSPIVMDIEAGTTVELRDDADATWQGVSYKGKQGFIYKAYLQ